MALVELLGEQIKGKDGKDVDVASFQGEGKVLGLYFSAHWCPPCRGFTPELAKWYTKLTDGTLKDKFDIVFISSDRDQNQFDEYFAEMPWKCLPYEERDKKAKLAKMFKITGIPSLVFLDGNSGKTITTDGRAIVTEDPEGQQFPWAPKSTCELLQGKLVGKDGKECTFADVKGKIVGLYFSAHWCGPCRHFTPKLVETYNKLKKDGKEFEIIFCSSDRDEASFKEYFNEMPWLSLPYGDKRKTALSRKFEVSGIPTLVILDSDCNLITTGGRGAVMADADGSNFPWYPKPLNELTGNTASNVNDHPCLIWFTDGSDDEVKEAISILQPIATAKCEEWKKAGEEPLVYFFYTKDDNSDDDENLASSLRSFANLPTKNPLLILLDIPNEVLYTGDFSSEDDKKVLVEKMLSSFKAGTLKMKPLRP